MKRANVFILLIVSTVACSRRGTISKYHSNVEHEFDIKISMSSISNLNYNKQSRPYVPCLREQYAHRVFDGKMHIENIAYFEYWSNTSGVPIDTIKKITLKELKKRAITLYQPLIGDFTPEMLKKELADTLKFHIKEKYHSNDLAEVFFNKNLKLTFNNESV